MAIVTHWCETVIDDEEYSIRYEYYAGYRGDWNNPPEPEQIIITSILVGDDGKNVEDFNEEMHQILLEACWEDLSSRRDLYLESIEDTKEFNRELDNEHWLWKNGL